MSFEGMRKSIRTMEAPISNADASAHLSDEFPAGYSLTRCSPAELVSASPAEVEHAATPDQLRGMFFHEGNQKPKQHDSGSTLIGQLFCPKDGVHFKVRGGTCVYT
jgi:hypothetical protein